MIALHMVSNTLLPSVQTGQNYAINPYP